MLAIAQNAPLTIQIWFGLLLLLLFILCIGGMMKSAVKDDEIIEKHRDQ